MGLALCKRRAESQTLQPRGQDCRSKLQEAPAELLEWRRNEDERVARELDSELRERHPEPRGRAVCEAGPLRCQGQELEDARARARALSDTGAKHLREGRCAEAESAYKEALLLAANSGDRPLQGSLRLAVARAREAAEEMLAPPSAAQPVLVPCETTVLAEVPDAKKARDTSRETLPPPLAAEPVLIHCDTVMLADILASKPSAAEKLPSHSVAEPVLVTCDTAVLADMLESKPSPAEMPPSSQAVEPVLVPCETKVLADVTDAERPSPAKTPPSAAEPVLVLCETTALAGILDTTLPSEAETTPSPSAMEAVLVPGETTVLADIAHANTLSPAEASGECLQNPGGLVDSPTQATAPDIGSVESTLSFTSSLQAHPTQIPSAAPPLESRDFKDVLPPESIVPSLASRDLSYSQALASSAQPASRGVGDQPTAVPSVLQDLGDVPIRPAFEDPPHVQDLRASPTQTATAPPPASRDLRAFPLPVLIAAPEDPPHAEDLTASPTQTSTAPPPDSCDLRAFVLPMSAAAPPASRDLQSLTPMSSRAPASGALPATGNARDLRPPASTICRAAASGSLTDDLARELEAFGVPAPRATEAARRHSSVEAAVEWLVACGDL